MRNLKEIYLTVMLLLGSMTFSFAQDIKGIVIDLKNDKRISEVEIKNLRTNQQTKSDAQGNFSIPGNRYDYLSLMVRGFDRDTAFIYQELGEINRIYLIPDKTTIQIDEVVVTKITDSRIAREIERAKNNSKAVETSQTKGGLRVSPSRLFGKDAKIARNAIKILELEQEQRFVDRAFTDELIQSLVPISDADLPLFKDKYKPSFEFAKAAVKEDLTAYILVSYAEFKKLKK
ncbi:hypothetical protein [Sphingobacterium kyonggiense]